MIGPSSLKHIGMSSKVVNLDRVKAVRSVCQDQPDSRGVTGMSYPAGSKLVARQKAGDDHDRLWDYMYDRVTRLLGWP